MDYLWQDKKRTLFGLPISFTRYSLTKERFFIESGCFTKKEDEVRLYRIMDVSLTRSLGQRLFGVGTIHCCSADKTLGDFDIVSVKDPYDVKEMISQAVEAQRDAKHVTNREYMYDMHGDDDYDDENGYEDEEI